MPSRHILEGVIFLHGTIHELHRQKKDGVLFKIDFKKSYDKVKWFFLRQVLRMKVLIRYGVSGLENLYKRKCGNKG